MPRALLLEDEPLTAMDLELTLQSANCEVTTHISCEAALDWLTFNTPDVAVVDIVLIDGPCHAVVEKLRETEVPVVIHSGDLPSQYVGTAFEHGVWVSKPSTSADLIEAVRQALVRGREGDALCPPQDQPSSELDQSVNDTGDLNGPHNTNDL